MFESWDEVGTMFWTVFGTFTNLFTYKGERSWNNIKKNSTRMVIGRELHYYNLPSRLFLHFFFLLGTYWVFTIIMTAAYSSSIISFITVPTYFDVVDSAADLLEEDFHIGTLGDTTKVRG